MKLEIHTDGGARGNPGPAAVGVVIDRIYADTGESVEIGGFGKTIGVATNNVAEYTAVIEALKHVILMSGQKQSGGVEEIKFYLDSTLVVNQLNGIYQIKNPNLRTLLTQVRILEPDAAATISYHSVPREQNQRADHFVNAALDGLL